MIDEEEVEKSFWLSRPDGWVMNRKLKRIVLLEFKRTTDTSETYYHDMRKVTEKQHTPILTGLKDLGGDRGWEVEVVPLVVGQRSTNCLTSMKSSLKVTDVRLLDPPIV